LPSKKKKSAKIGYSSVLYCLEAYWLLSATAGTQHRGTDTNWLDMNKKNTASYYCRVLSSKNMSMSTQEQCTVLLYDSTTEQKDSAFLNALNILSQHTLYQCCFHWNAIHYPAERKKMVSPQTQGYDSLQGACKLPK